MTGQRRDSLVAIVSANRGGDITVTRNTLCIALLAAMAATGALPQTALASCSGTACSAVSVTPTYNASSKQIVVTLRNKDQTNAVHIKYSVSADGRSITVDTDLDPHVTTTRNVPFTGPGAPAKYEAEVRNADFKGGQAASATGSGTASMDFGHFGKVTYLVAKQSVVVPLLTKFNTSYTSASTLYSDALDHAKTLDSLTVKIGSKEAIEAEARASRNKNPLLQVAAGAAAHGDNELDLLVSLIASAKNHSTNAKADLDITEAEYKNMQDQNKANDLRKTAQAAEGALGPLFKAISLGYEASLKITAGKPTPEVIAKPALEAMNGIIGAFRSANLEHEADELQKKVDQNSEIVADRKLAQATKEMHQLQEELDRLEKQLPAFQQAHGNDWKTVGNIYGAAKSGRLPDMESALEEAKATRDLIYKASGFAVDAHAKFEQLSNLDNWLAPGTNLSAICQMDDTAQSIKDRCIKMLPQVEATQKRAEELYTAAQEAFKSEQK